MLTPFHELTPEVIEAIAHICHEANRDYCASMHDYSHLPWEETPVELRQSAINGVMFCIAKDFPSPEAMHMNWYAEKASQGYKWGPLKDHKAKLHPNFLPYANLSEGERMKDRLFKTIVAAICYSLHRPAQPPKEEIPENLKPFLTPLDAG